MCMFFLDMTDLANWTCSIVEGQVHRKGGISHSTYNSEVFFGATFDADPGSALDLQICQPCSASEGQVDSKVSGFAMS